MKRKIIFIGIFVCLVFFLGCGSSSSGPSFIHIRYKVVGNGIYQAKVKYKIITGTQLGPYNVNLPYDSEDLLLQRGDYAWIQAQGIDVQSAYTSTIRIEIYKEGILWKNSQGVGFEIVSTGGQL